MHGVAERYDTGIAHADDRVDIACCDCTGNRNAGRYFGLAVVVSSPGNDLTGTSECHRVADAGTDFDDVFETGWDFALILTVTAPADDGAVATEGQRVVESTGDSDDVSQGAWDVGLPPSVAPPCDNFATLDGECM